MKLNARRAGQRAVDGVDRERDEHQETGGAQVARSGREQRSQADHAPARGEGVDAPREGDAARGRALGDVGAHRERSIPKRLYC